MTRRIGAQTAISRDNPTVAMARIGGLTGS
jgi:hypothetical protein